MSRIKTAWLVLALGAAGAAAGCTTASDGGETAAKVPRVATLDVCHGYDCHFRTKVTITAQDSRVLAGYFRGATTPGAERAAIARAVQLFENKATKTIGIADRPQSAFLGAKERGQMDCLDETANTLTLLRYLAGRGLLKHHTVSGDVSRGFLLDARYFHSAASIKEGGGTRWAVDSWFGKAGSAPQIMPLDVWRSQGNLSELWEG